MVYGWTDLILGFLFPPACRACGDPGLGSHDICAGCYRELPRAGFGCAICAEPLTGPALVCGRCQTRGPAFDQVVAPYLYAPPVDMLVQELKFAGRLASGRLLGELLARFLVRRQVSADLIVPLPLHASRLRTRGFNQAMELARPTARALDIRLEPRRLIRARKTRMQSELPRGKRLQNVRGAFVTRGRLDGLRVALVDDVLTTGHTADAAARALKAAGAANVTVWVAARVTQKLPGKRP